MLTVSIGEQIEAARALIARLSVEDTGEEERAALLALRDAVLTRAPLANVRPLTNQERLANNARARFDAAFPPPTDGPVASAVDRAAHRRLNAEERTARAGRLGRYYVEGYEIGGGAIRWRVQDRYIDGVAFFALDDPKKPARLEGYADSAEALKRVYWLDAYFHDRGCTIGPRATTVPITELISGIVCAYVPPALPPLLPKPKRSRSPNPEAPAVVRTPGRLAVARILPDEVWFRVGSLIPPEPADKQTKKPRVTSDRTALAGILTYLRSDAGWHSIPRTIGCSPTLVVQGVSEDGDRTITVSWAELRQAAQQRVSGEVRGNQPGNPVRDRINGSGTRYNGVNIFRRIPGETSTQRFARRQREVAAGADPVNHFNN